MDRDTTVGLAREAGLFVGTNITGVRLVGSKVEEGSLLCHITVEELTRFATLVESHAIRTRLLDEVGEAIKREREACAYKAGIALLGADRGLSNRVDQAIRSRA